MRAVDTNVLLRLILLDDTTQVAAARSFTEEGGWVSTIVLAETIWVLASNYDFTVLMIEDTITTLVEESSLVFQDADAVRAALELFRSRPRLGFSHCLVLELARKYDHVPLGTFDRALARVPGARRL